MPPNATVVAHFQTRGVDKADSTAVPETVLEYRHRGAIKVDGIIQADLQIAAQNRNDSTRAKPGK